MEDDGNWCNFDVAQAPVLVAWVTRKERCVVTDAVKANWSMPWILVARATRIESFQPLNATENAPDSLYNNALYVFNCNSLCNSLYLSDSNAKYANPFIHSCILMYPIHQYYTPTHNLCIHSYPNHSLMQYNSQDNAMLFIHAGLITVRYIHTTCSAIRTVTEIPLYV